MEENTIDKRVIISFIVGVVVGIALTLIGTQLFGGDDDTQESDEDSATTTPKIDSLEKNAVVTANQKPGFSADISHIVLDKIGWVAIHDLEGDTIGKTLGAKLFDKGTSTGVVKLLRAMVSGNNYTAVLHNDDGDRKYDSKKDLPILDMKGEPVMIRFKAE